MTFHSPAESSGSSTSTGTDPNALNVFRAVLFYKHTYFITKIITFRGDLTDTSAETKFPDTGSLSNRPLILGHLQIWL